MTVCQLLCNEYEEDGKRCSGFLYREEGRWDKAKVGVASCDLYAFGDTALYKFGEHRVTQQWTKLQE